MYDLLMIALWVGFGLASLGLVWAFGRLMGRDVR